MFRFNLKHLNFYFVTILNQLNHITLKSQPPQQQQLQQQQLLLLPYYSSKQKQAKMTTTKTTTNAITKRTKIITATI